jgi:hypothetical protein
MFMGVQGWFCEQFPDDEPPVEPAVALLAPVVPAEPELLPPVVWDPAELPLEVELDSLAG